MTFEGSSGGYWPVRHFIGTIVIIVVFVFFFVILVLDDDVDVIFSYLI